MPSATRHGTLPFTLETRYRLAPADGDHPAPLVILLHGQGMSGEQMQRLTALPSPGRHLLAPDGIYPFEKRKPGAISIGHAWYLYTGDQPAFRAELERGEAHLLRLLDRVVGEVAVDPRRVTLAGYSQGGYLAGFVALRNRARFRGLVLAGTRLKHEFLTSELAAPDLPAVLFVHSPADPALRWDSVEPGVEALRAAGARVAVERHDEGHRIPADFGARLGRWLDAEGL